MALLTAEDVLNKAFSKTKYREGFDQDEVDDFLDEVANAISALTAERDELQSRLAQYQAGGVPAPVATAPVLAAAPVTQTSLSSASADLLAAATDPNPPSATTMLSMAQRLHDDYVQAGEAERDRIIGEGKAKAESIVEQAEMDARVRMQSLDSDRADLERRIDDLRRFERDYRGHLRNYLENLLGDLEHNSARDAVSTPVVDSLPKAPERPVATAPVVASPALDSFAAAGLAGAGFDVAPTLAAAEPERPVAPAVAATPAPAPTFPSAEPAPVVPVQAFPEPLPPFPGTPEAAAPIVSPFTDVNPFAAASPATGGQRAVPDLAAPAAGEEPPRWNF